MESLVKRKENVGESRILRDSSVDKKRWKGWSINNETLSKKEARYEGTKRGRKAKWGELGNEMPVLYHQKLLNHQSSWAVPWLLLLCRWCLFHVLCCMWFAADEVDKFRLIEMCKFHVCQGSKCWLDFSGDADILFWVSHCSNWVICCIFVDAWSEYCDVVVRASAYERTFLLMSAGNGRIGERTSSWKPHCRT